MNAVDKCIAALTARPWRRDLGEAAIAASLFITVALLAWSLQGVS